MRWSNLFIIFRREVRDQIRDRRTLFMIFVLPILLYPILGIGVTKFAMALEQKPRVVIVVGPEYLPASPALLNSTGDGYEADRLSGPKSASLALTDAASSSRMPLAKPSHRTKPGNLSALKGAKP